MKKLQLKKDVIERLDNKMKFVKGGGDTTVYGDSGGTLCASCNGCVTKTCQTFCEKCPEPTPIETKDDLKSVPMIDCEGNTPTGKTLCHLCW